MRRLTNKFALAIVFLSTGSMAHAAIYTLTVAGLGGDPQYEERFVTEAQEIHSAVAAGAQASFLTGLGATRDTILGELERWSTVMSVDDAAVLILVGHGASGGNQYRFNVVGPDLTGQELNEALESLPANRQLIVNTTSASGALLETLAEKPGRVVITATKNGRELQATRFSTYFAQALRRPSADLDKDQRISAAEAFDFARSAVADYFETEGLLATEHARQVGGDPKAIILARLGGAVSAAAQDAVPAELLASQQSINDQIRALRARRSEMEQADYLSELQSLLVELSRISEQIEALNISSGETP